MRSLMHRRLILGCKFNSLTLIRISKFPSQTRNALHINVQLALFRYLTTLWEHAVAQLVEVLRYRTEGRGLDSRWCQWNFSLT
jgi:hypothetical protein